MVAGTVDSFRRALQSLSPAGCMRFIADLYREVGYDVTAQFGEIVLRKDENTYRLRVETNPGTGSVPFLVVPVDPQPHSDGHKEVLDSDHVWNLLRYKLDQDNAEKLVTHYFDCSLDELDERYPEKGNTITAPLLVVVAVALVVVGTIVTTGLLPFNEEMPTEDDIDPTDESQVADDTIEDRFDPYYPPGLENGAVSDPDRLVHAHRSAIASQSYQKQIRFSGPPTQTIYPNMTSFQYTKMISGATYLSMSERTIIETNDYRTQTVEIGEYRDGVQSFNWRITDREGHVYRNATYVERSFNPTGSHDSSIFYHAILSADSVDVETIQRAGDLRYRIRATGSPSILFQEPVNFSAIAVITQSGRLDELSISYEDSQSRESISLVVTYSGVGRQSTIDPPEYVIHE